MTRVLSRRVLAALVAIMVAFAFMPAIAQDTYAAVKKPGTPKITSVQVSSNTVTLKWSKAKQATKYQVYKASGTTWKYWKKVKKSQKNKYKNTARYKLKKSGSKYKVYKKAPRYVVLTTTNGCTYTYSGNYSTTYTFVVRAYNSKKASAYSTARSIRTQAKPQPKPPAPAKPETGLHSGDSEGTGSSPSITQPTQPTISKPGQVSNLTTTISNYEDRFRIDLTWSAASGATEYEIYRRTGSGATATNYGLIKTTTKCNYALATSQINTKFSFKVIAKNSAGNGAEVTTSCVTPAELPTVNTGEYDNNPSTAWNQYLNEMLGYYKAELSKRGVSINSTNKADDFQKLQAIIQVMHDYVGYSERTTGDYANFPTGRENFTYFSHAAAIAGTDKSGDYYNGKDYVETIKFYGSCDTIADTEKFLAEKAGLGVYTLGQVNSGHKYAVICANYVWYNADPGIYMVAGTGLNDINNWVSPSTFKEYKYNMQYKLSDGTTLPINEQFKINNVFYGTAKSVTSSGGLSFDVYPGIGIDPENAKYTSSDESILSFDEEDGTCTLHHPGIVYVTITYNNLKPNASKIIPSITTTIKVLVQE